MSGAMVHCDGCGFNVEPCDARECDEYIPVGHCSTCAKCVTEPLLRESYRRGFNAGLDALAEAVTGIVKNSNLRRQRRE